MKVSGLDGASSFKSTGKEPRRRPLRDAHFGNGTSEHIWMRMAGCGILDISVELAGRGIPLTNAISIYPLGTMDPRKSLFNWMK
jgi:hypothetical protein